MKVAIIGCGVIGAGWAARFMLNGHDVSIFDPAPDAERCMREVLAHARSSLPALYDRPLPPVGRLDFARRITEAVTGADWVQESVPERLEVKRSTYAAIEPYLGNEAILASSTSAIRPSKLQELCSQPARLIVAHPFNPVYLLPLVEVVGSDLTPPALKARTAGILQGIGMYPLVLDREIDGFIGNRLQEAMWREALWMIKDGVATTAQIDEAILYGFGLRCAQMGQFETYRLSGGEAGMRHFFAQFGPSLAEPLSHLMDVPDLDTALIDRIADQSDAQSAGRSIREMERTRDASLVALIRALKPRRVGAGGTVRAHEAQLHLQQDGSLPVTARRVIPSSWTEANGHINETHYIEIASNAADALTESCGVTAEYIAAGRSHFTAETHVRYLVELHEGDEITVRTQVLYGTGKKTHLFHRFYGPDEKLAATVEMMILHVDLTTRAVREPLPHVAGALKSLEEAHAHLPRPEEAGTAIRDLRKAKAERARSSQG
ncbi:carnitine 3-dehydrogenase [Mesorhizobium temperatum]|uniref:Carnitine 3-dehydrogenase n=1 Tax=Mesorhizobium temperatum TaxID=241416 RepID=A0A271LHP4_9HYPH|nr:carnitine 3-dehydrogenase [Mesorhizobium temperatum]PAQ07629.1 carnitine 3-dehydrogenase [Mesorhizobium temperatum]